MDIELLHQPRAMGFGRLNADVEDRGELLGRFLFTDQLQYLSFTDRQPIPRKVGFLQERVHNDLGYSRAQVQVSAKDLPDRMREIGGGL